MSFSTTGFYNQQTWIKFAKGREMFTNRKEEKPQGEQGITTLEGTQHTRKKNRYRPVIKRGKFRTSSLYREMISESSFFFFLTNFSLFEFQGVHGVE
jgi:hypothetical protein